MVTIKRYPNRKLYDTQARQYITLGGIAELIQKGSEVRVIDHTSGEDLTALTLTQVIMEQERRKSGFLSDITLTGLIRSGGDCLSAIQHSPPFPHDFLRHFDEEIRQRLQALVNAGELTELEGKNFLEKLLRPTAQLEEIPYLNRQIEAFVSRLHIPSREDVMKLNRQLDELTARLTKIHPVDDPSRDQTGS